MIYSHATCYKTLEVHADIQQKHQSISYYIVPFIIVLEKKPKYKLDENERNINTLLFGNDKLHLETNKKILICDFFAPNRPLVNR